MCCIFFLSSGGDTIKKNEKSDTLERKKPLLDGFCVTIAVLPISEMCYHYE